MTYWEKIKKYCNNGFISHHMTEYVYTSVLFVCFTLAPPTNMPQLMIYALFIEVNLKKSQRFSTSSCTHTTVPRYQPRGSMRRLDFTISVTQKFKVLQRHVRGRVNEFLLSLSEWFEFQLLDQMISIWKEKWIGFTSRSSTLSLHFSSPLFSFLPFYNFLYQTHTINFSKLF